MHTSGPLLDALRVTQLRDQGFCEFRPHTKPSKAWKVDSDAGTAVTQQRVDARIRDHHQPNVRLVLDV